MTPLECEIIVGSIPAGAISRKGGSIWGMSVKTASASVWAAKTASASVWAAKTINATETSYALFKASASEGVGHFLVRFCQVETVHK